MIHLILFLSQTIAAEDSIKTVNTGAWHAITSASPVVQLTLLLLVAMSVISWAIIFYKRKEMQKVKAENAKFLDFFWEAKSLDEVNRELRRYKHSPLAKIFQSGYKELLKIVENKKDAKSPQFSVSQIDNIHRVLRNASDREMNELENRLNFLATTGSTGPFIGLFGTVWGIMGSFQKIGATGSASLAVVAPGISEALIATAIGLLAAIPAVIFYNHFSTQLNSVDMDLSQFQSDLLNIIRRNFVLD
jgi:biopolymer transport protein TolQ